MIMIICELIFIEKKLRKLQYYSFFVLLFSKKGLDVNGILDELNDEQIATIDMIYAEPLDGEDSDGYDFSDTESGDPAKFSRSMLKVKFSKKV